MLLKKGDNNENVKLMQEKLGISPAVTNFGPKTEAAVKEFQSKHGLPADGIVGDATWAKIMGEGTPPPAPAAPIAPVGGLKLDGGAWVGYGGRDEVSAIGGSCGGVG